MTDYLLVRKAQNFEATGFDVLPADGIRLVLGSMDFTINFNRQS